VADTAYIEAFNRAVDQANRLQMDVGILRNKLFNTYDVFLLPKPANRSGHELRAEVVRPGTPKMQLRGLSGFGRADPPPKTPRRGGGWLPERPAGPPPIDWKLVAAAVHRRHKDFDWLTPDQVRRVAAYADWETAASDLIWSAGHEPKAPQPPPEVENAGMGGRSFTPALVWYVLRVRGGVRRELVDYFGRPQ